MIIVRAKQLSDSEVEAESSDCRNVDIIVFEVNTSKDISFQLQSMKTFYTAKKHVLSNSIPVIIDVSFAACSINISELTQKFMDTFIKRIFKLSPNYILDYQISPTRSPVTDNYIIMCAIRHLFIESFNWMDSWSKLTTVEKLKFEINKVIVSLFLEIGRKNITAEDAFALMKAIHVLAIQISAVLNIQDHAKDRAQQIPFLISAFKTTVQSLAEKSAHFKTIGRGIIGALEGEFASSMIMVCGPTPNLTNLMTGDVGATAMGFPVKDTRSSQVDTRFNLWSFSSTKTESVKTSVLVSHQMPEEVKVPSANGLTLQNSPFRH